MPGLHLEKEKGTINASSPPTAFIAPGGPAWQNRVGTPVSFMKWYYDFLKITYCYTVGSLQGLLTEEVQRLPLLSVYNFALYFLIQCSGLNVKEASIFNFSWFFPCNK
jgi:uncharacterized membrane protein YbjE (DUF340 family)